jgi:predicted acylesterase/phospholipase RssA
MTTPRIGLALSGGGSKGAFTVGALKVVRQQLGVTQFPVISGTSTGSLVGTMLAVDDWAALVDVYSNVKTKNIVNPNYALVAGIAGPEAVLFAAAVLGGRSIFDTTALRMTVRANVDFQAIKKAFPETLLIYNTVDLQTGQAATFNNRDHSATMLQDALLASASMPVLMDPIDITLGGETHQHVDGGVREFIPLAAVFDSDVDVDYILAIATAPIAAKKRKDRYDKITDILARTIDLMDTEVGLNDYMGALQYDVMLGMVDNATGGGVSKTALLKGVPSPVAKSLKDKRSVPVVLIAPDDHFEMDSLTFESGPMRDAMALGVASAKKALKDL